MPSDAASASMLAWSRRQVNDPSAMSVNCGWVPAANIAADLSAWCRLLGLYDQDDLKDAEPDTLRYRLISPPGWPATPVPAC